MTTLILAVAIAIAGSTIELYELHAIITHPAGGWEGLSGATTLAYAGAALLPYVAVLAWAVTRPAARYRALRYCSIVSAIGIFIAFVALRQYGHATPLFLAVGYVAQLVCVTIGILRERKSFTA